MANDFKFTPEEIPPATYHHSRYQRLRNEQSIFRLHWHDLARFMSPRRGRYLLTDTDVVQFNGAKKNQHIINGTAFQAVRTFGAGMQGGLTSPSRPWMKLEAAGDQGLNGYTPVKQWLDIATRRLLAVFAASNFYASNHSTYEELGIFGPASMIIDEDFDYVINCRPLTIGEFCFSLDARYSPTTMYRSLNLTALQIAELFGQDGHIPLSVQSALMCRNYEQRFECLHAIWPSKMVDPTKADYRSMPYSSVYLLKGGGEDGILKEGGYNSLPFTGPRWGAYGADPYGDSAGMQALGDVRQLQKMEEKKLIGLDKIVDPPMVGPSSLKGNGATTVPGGLTFVDQAAGVQGFRPAYEVSIDVEKIAAEIKNVEDRIGGFFFNPLFLSILSQEKEMTATEIAKRYEEKVQMLGPVIESVQRDSLGVSIDRTFDIMVRHKLFPPPPPELQGQALKVNYTSSLAQAQKLVSANPIQQFTEFLGAVAPMAPQATVRVNFDKMVQHYADATGLPPDILNSDAVVAKTLAQQAQNASAANMSQAAPGLAQAAKSASQAQLGGDQNLLQAVTGNKGPTNP